MRRDTTSDLMAFLAVVRERNFTKAAASLGVSQSALSHTMRQLEERLGVRLLTRTTRAVAPTVAGQQLADRIGPHFQAIGVELDALNEWRDKPAGSIRLCASDHAASAVLWPRLGAFLGVYPDIIVELVVDNGLTDIINGRFDAGVRMGEHLARDMISARITPDIVFAVVGSPAYFARRPVPSRPQDLDRHSCIGFRFSEASGIYVWEFEDPAGQAIRVRTAGQFVTNNSFSARAAARDGIGLAYLPEDLVRDDLASGRLVRVLQPWLPRWDGLYLYYPSRRQSSPAFTVLVEALRHREAGAGSGTATGSGSGAVAAAGQARGGNVAAASSKP